ncbi:MAG: response regulator [Vicinamibacterales bacterium]
MLHDHQLWRSPAPDARHRLKAMDSETTRVLVIDDDPDALALLRARLEHTGRFTVITAASGQAGLELARDMDPALIVCDIYMPGMGGADVAAALAADDNLRQIPLLFLSALVKPDEIREHNGQIGGWPMASKSESIHSIVRRIDTLLHRTRGRR